MGCISDRNPKARKILCMIETTAIFHCSVVKKGKGIKDHFKAHEGGQTNQLPRLMTMSWRTQPYLTMTVAVIHTSYFPNTFLRCFTPARSDDPKIRTGPSVAERWS